MHCCAQRFPIQLMQAAGVRGVFADIDQLSTADWDLVGEGLEQGLEVGMGAMPAGGTLSADEVAERALRPIRVLEVDPSAAGQLVVTPACGLAGLSHDAALQAIRAVRTAAGIVTEQLAE